MRSKLALLRRACPASPRGLGSDWGRKGGYLETIESRTLSFVNHRCGCYRRTGAVAGAECVRPKRTGNRSHSEKIRVRSADHPRQAGNACRTALHRRRPHSWISNQPCAGRCGQGRSAGADFRHPARVLDVAERQGHLRRIRRENPGDLSFSLLSFLWFRPQADERRTDCRPLKRSNEEEY
jgi:hypothetical protein